jgi:hypothetical protein
MNFFGLLNFQAPYLPWVLLGFSLLLGNSIMVDLMGEQILQLPCSCKKFCFHFIRYCGWTFVFLFGGCVPTTTWWFQANQNPIVLVSLYIFYLHITVAITPHLGKICLIPYMKIPHTIRCPKTVLVDLTGAVVSS